MEGLHFKITGHFITNFVRTRYKETNNLNEAVSLLQQMIIGFPRELATEVILGRKKILGTEIDLELEDDDVIVVPYGTIVPSEIEDVQCGWVAPDGTVYGHHDYNGMSDHIDLAVEIVKALKLKALKAYADEFNVELILELEGYIKFSPKGAIGSVTAAYENKFTQKQKDVIARYAAYNGGKIVLGYDDYDEFTDSQILQMDMIQFKNHITD